VITVRTYGFPGFYEATRNLGSQPSQRTDRVEACRPRDVSYSSHCTALALAIASTLTEPRRAPAAIRLLTGEMRAAYLAIAALVVGLGFSTFVLTEHTERWWAWTIKVPMTAALLGAGYWAGLALLLIAVREREWARARVVVPVAFTLDVSLLLTVFLHWSDFHDHSVVGWVWLLSYLALPPGLIVLLVRQLREPGADRPPVVPMGGGMRLVLGAQAAALLLAGAALFLAPGTFGDDWAWPLVPLGAQAVGGMLMTHGVGVAGALYEGAWERVLAPMTSYLVLAVLHGVLLLRYGGRLEWDRPAVWLYAGFVVTVLAAGAAGLRAALDARGRAP
jgi:hypothetical protein